MLRGSGAFSEQVLKPQLRAAWRSPLSSPSNDLFPSHTCEETEEIKKGYHEAAASLEQPSSKAELKKPQVCYSN